MNLFSGLKGEGMLNKGVIPRIEEIIKIYREQQKFGIEEYKEFQEALHRIVESEGFKVVDSEEFEELYDDYLFLNCLRNNGVDNWEWYSEAVDEYQQIKGEE
jgi:predicted house-cleaning noncanonical NTP pyrophosphatase (MazG superfamily)